LITISHLTKNPLIERRGKSLSDVNSVVRYSNIYRTNTARNPREERNEVNEYSINYLNNFENGSRRERLDIFLGASEGWLAAEEFDEPEGVLSVAVAIS